ncbi:glycoside hydrolase family 3 C-terminal domain-containing protein [Kineosporia sp. J2-2]|uniref:beta-glucosidase n=1 Tax=Kineosporia corallincola TaxID=2835133 RepID=A0ABS5TFY3_9ACTN|nr:glycoside hydrolase family 3 N-terminal domain-containing protein [Kineosporia corallincola]MBT0768519.1 glycoside hydrolase family 3 C-terminal domain-containing protein [Kineosporia corallincola]
MNPYQNPALPVEKRVEDLLGRMTLTEKAGLMFHTMAAVNPDGTLPPGDAMIPDTGSLIRDGQLNHFNILTFAPVTPRRIAEWHNRIQEIAAGTRLGIPVTVSTDPRHGVIDNPAASAAAGGFSAWPEPIGLGATKDPAVVRQFADIARQEYLAAGIRVALHPMADLASEPRWARTSGTLGSDADMVSELIAAYVRGLQGPELGPGSVVAMVKHFPGAGPQKDGEDAHFAYGREQVYPGDNWEYHLKPFEAAFAAGAAQIMPYYGMPVGTGHEEVGFSFNRGVIEGLLRQRYGFDGVVCTDWGLVTDAEIMGSPMPARAWGVEHLDRLSRIEKILNAGADQLGGEQCPELIVELVGQGRISTERIDVSVRRILRDKFRLGLFDHRRYVDPDLAEQVAGQASFRRAGLEAQRRSIVVLTNHTTLPLAEGVTVYLDGVDPAVAQAYAKVTDDPAAADVAIVRRGAPHEPREGGFEAFFHSGRLDFTDQELAPLLSLAATVPTVLDVMLDRPAVLTPLADETAALVGTFGVSDEALLDVLFGRSPATGTLPFELPSSMAAVEASREDVPNDTAGPLFPYGHGLTL